MTGSSLFVWLFKLWAGVVRALLIWIYYATIHNDIGYFSEAHLFLISFLKPENYKAGSFLSQKLLEIFSLLDFLAFFFFFKISAWVSCKLVSCKKEEECTAIFGCFKAVIGNFQVILGEEKAFLFWFLVFF